VNLFRQINKLAEQLAETQEQAQRSERLAKMGGDMEEWSQKSAQKQRRKSRDLSQELGNLGDEMLEKAFKQFDQDGNGTLDADELSAALRAAGCETVVCICSTPSNVGQCVDAGARIDDGPKAFRSLYTEKIMVRDCETSLNRKQIFLQAPQALVCHGSCARESSIASASRWRA